MGDNYSISDLEPGCYQKLKSLPYEIGTIGNSHDTGLSFSCPTKIGHYSLSIDKRTEQRTAIFDDSMLSYLWLPPEGEPFRFDLSKDYSEYGHLSWCSVANAKLDELLQWILQNKITHFSNNETKPLEADFVTYRGVLTKLMVTPFVRDKWLLGACKFKGTIYLCPYYDNQEASEQNNLFSYGGHRFEHYLTRSEPKLTENVPFTPEKGEFSVVMRSKLQSKVDKISLLYAAEVDCLDLGQTDANKVENFVEIKTTRKMKHEGQYRNFQRFKLIKWWAQSYLIGLPKIICGYKNDQHVVDQIDTFNVHHIPNICAAYWSRRQCFNFLHQFLKYVMEIVVENDPNQVYLFTNESNVIECKHILLPGSKFNILPEWYTKQFLSVHRPNDGVT